MNSSREYTVDWLLLIMPGLGKLLIYKLSMVVGREKKICYTSCCDRKIVSVKAINPHTKDYYLTTFQ